MLGDLAELRTFQRVLALGSLSAAARDLNVSLAVVSKRLIALERRTGVRLVNRTTRRLSPTEAGLALLSYAERILDEVAGAEAHLASGRDTVHGVLRVAAPVSFGRLHVAPLLADLTDQHPGLSIDLTLGDALLDLVESRIDVAVRIGAPQDSRAVMRKLADNHRILVAAPAYLDRRGRPGDPRAAEGLEFLRYGPSHDPWALRGPAGKAYELAAPCRLRADSGDVVHDWAVAGRGVMLKSQVDVAGDLAARRLERVLPGWQSAAAPVYALLPSNRQAPPKTRVLVEALAARLGNLAAACGA